MVSKDKRPPSSGSGSSRHGGRVVLSLDVEPNVRDALRGRAAASGVSMAEYLANAIVRPERSYATASAEIAQPLTQVSYRLAQAARALDREDVTTAATELDAARKIAAEAMASLCRRHAEETRGNDSRRGGGWNG